MVDKAISVSELNNYIKSIFEAEVMLHGISVYGEITDLQLVRDVAYYTIKDSSSALQCVTFGVQGKFDNIKNGDQVVVTGSPNYYAKLGRFSFNVYKIEPYGQGLLYLQFLLLKEKLEKEGLFDTIHKKPMPKTIKTLGVITSQTGAVIQDIINVTRRRNPNTNIVLFPAKVQGEGSVPTIIEGINFFENYGPVDVIIIARGGGSMEDLAVFNDEILARRIFACSKFVLSAVGHETDFTIADFVADLRAPTPSAAAELVTKNISNVKETFENYNVKLQKTLQRIIDKKESNVKFVWQKLLYLTEKILKNTENKFLQNKNKLLNAIDNYINQKEYALAISQTQLTKLNPQKILSLGYAKIEQNNQSINTLSNLNSNQTFEVIMQDGKIKAKQEN